MSARFGLVDALTRDQALSRNSMLFIGLIGSIAVVLAGITHPRLLWLLILFAAAADRRAGRSAPDAPFAAPQLSGHGALRAGSSNGCGRSCAPISSRATSTAGRSAMTSARWSMPAPRATISTHPFGTELDVYSDEYEWLAHSMAPSRDADKYTRVTVGTDQCGKPYQAVAAQHLGDELRRARRQRDRGAEPGREDRRLLPRHRRRRAFALSSEAWRRRRLGDRIGLFRLPRQGWPFRSRAFQGSRRASTRSR